MRELRPHQVKSIEGLKDALRAGSKRVMLDLPTGAGKTVIAAHVVAGARAKGNRVVFCVPSLSLIGQTFERFVENGIDPGELGVIQADHPMTRAHAPVQIASAQTLGRRELPITDVVVIDEAHVRHKVYEQWMQIKPDMPFIGLSATPWATGLGKLYDTLIKPVTLADLIAAGYLSPFRVYAPSTPDLTGVKTVAGDYQEDQLGEAMSTPTLVADVVSTWLAKGGGEKTLCFAVNRNHAAKLTHEFGKAGVRVAYVDAFTPRDERDEIGKRFATGEIQVVVNIGVLTTGVDWDVRCLILARPTKSEMLFVQIFGRALRTAPGKEVATILDHSSTTLTLGLPTEIHHDRLSMGKADDKKEAEKKERDKPLPKVCPACGILIAPRQRECGECGMPMFGPTGVQELQGELVELGAGKVRGKREEPVTDRLRALGKATVWAMLLAMERQFSWKDRVKDHRYRDIFGVWPRDLRHVRPIEPAPELQSWVRSRNIAYAKSMKTGRAA